jgi:hypothetical protein
MVLTEPIRLTLLFSWEQFSLHLGRECGNGNPAPPPCKMFIWLVLKNRVWTADRLAKRGLPHNVFKSDDLLVVLADRRGRLITISWTTWDMIGPNRFGQLIAINRTT